jgi:hypothetical protein
MAPHDGGQTLPPLLDQTSKRAQLASPVPDKSGSLRHRNRKFRSRLPPRWFVAAVTAIGAMQLLSVMDGTVAVVALPNIQNDLGL